MPRRLALLAAVLAAGHLAQPPLGARQATPPAEALSKVADELAREVEAMRGWSFTQPVARRRVTPEQVREYVNQRVEKDLAPGRLAATQAFLHTIGLIPADCDLKRTTLSLLENQVGGYYDPDTRTLCLVDRPGGMPGIAERMILAHELTHALDDQQLGIGAYLKGASGVTEEGDLVASSLTEGSATGLMVQYLARRQMTGTLDLAELQAYAKAEAERSKPLLDAPRYFSTMVASYICGMQFLARGNLMTLMVAPDNKAFGEAFRIALSKPPRSTEQILHPAKYWELASRDEPVVIADEPAGRWLDEPGRFIVHRDTVGELLAAILTSAPKPLDPATLQLSSAWTSTGASGWGGDRFYLTAAGPSAAEAAAALTSLRGVWVTAWDTAADRDEFLEGLKAGPLPAGAISVPLASRAAVVFIGYDEPARASLVNRLAKAPLAFSRDGQPWTPD